MQELEERALIFHEITSYQAYFFQAKHFKFFNFMFSIKSNSWVTEICISNESIKRVLG